MKTKNLSLAEAHASGRKYRAIGDPYYDNYTRFNPNKEVSWFYATALYELEPEAKLLTRKEVFLAVKDELYKRDYGRCAREDIAFSVANQLFASKEGER